MTRCRTHRAHYGRLFALPSVAATTTAAAGTVLVAAVAAGSHGGTTALVLLALGAAGIAGYLRHHRARLALELRMVDALHRSRPHCPGEITLAGLHSDVQAETMADGHTRLTATSWLDAVRAWGFVLGRDRGFQLDWLRRMAAGRLAEVCGRTALPLDEGYRRLDFAGVADQAIAALAPPERELLEAFASGIAAAWDRDGPPFECRFLNYRPQPWRPADSILIGLLLFHGLSWKEEPKRAEAVIRHVLPEQVADFLLPGGDPELPEQLATLRRHADPAAGIVVVDPPVSGSNCWVRGGIGGPALACDLHLPLGLPNPLYEVDLRWPGGSLRGLAPAGLPVVLTGSNGRLAWGVTNLNADVLDVAAGAAGVEEVLDQIPVRGGVRTMVEIAREGTSVRSARPLLGEPVRVRWTGFDPRSWDLRFQRLAQATSVHEGLAILDRGHGIALNVLLADQSGRTAHVATGLLPRRPAGTSRPADGFLTGTQRPRTVDPPDTVLISANDQALPEHGYRICYDPDTGHRARRLRDLLADMSRPDPAAMRGIQHDTRAELYLPYRDLAVAALRGRDEPLAAVLSAWDGNADPDSVGFPVLVRLREMLARRVLSPYLWACREHDPGFRYSFQVLDRPLLAIIRSGDPSLLPPGAEHDGWDGFIARCVRELVRDLAAGGTRLPRWGRLNRIGLRHPLAQLAPWAGRLLGIRAMPMGGAMHCVRTCVPGFAAVGRAVLRPGPDAVAEFATPAGQSGHPLNRHYRDRHADWASPAPYPARQRRPGCHFVLRAVPSP